MHPLHPPPRSAPVTVINTSTSFHPRVSKSRWSENNIFTKEKHIKPTWPTDAVDKLLPRLFFFRAKLYAFLVSPRQKPSSRRLNTLVQKQYLVGEVGENCLLQV